MEISNDELKQIIGIKIDDGGTYDIPGRMSNNIFVASDFKTLSKVRLPLGGIPVPTGGGTSGEFIYISNMGDLAKKPVLEVIMNRSKKTFYGIGEDASADIIAIQWGETVLFYYPANGAPYIYYIRFQSPDEISTLPQNPTFNSVTVTDHLDAKQIDLSKWLLMYSKAAGTNPTIRLAQNFLSGVGANATKTLDRESCYIEIGGAEYGKDSYRLIGMGYQKNASDLQPLMFGFQETDTAGNTVGDFVVFLRDSTANNTPKEVLRITSKGEIIGNGLPPSSDNNLISKKYVDDSLPAKHNVVVLDDAAANGDIHSYAFKPNDIIVVDSTKTWTAYCLENEQFKPGDTVEIIVHKGPSGNFGQIFNVQFNNGSVRTYLNGKSYAGFYVDKPCTIRLVCVTNTAFYVTISQSDETLLAPNLNDPIG